MTNDRHCFLVLEESLPEGTIAEHRTSRPKAHRRSRANGRRLRTAVSVIRTSARPKTTA